MGFIERTEKKFGKYAVSGLTMKLAVMQILFFLFYMLNLEFEKNSISTQNVVETVYKLNIGNTTIISDIIFIIGSPVILPGSLLSYFFFYFMIQLFITFGSALEELWGKYKFNLYVLSIVCFGLASSQVFKMIYPQIANYPLIYYSSIVYSAISFSFATYYPKYEIHLFFVLPTPVKFLAYLGAGTILYLMIDMNNFDRFFWGLGAFGSYILFHYKMAVDKQVAKARKANFDKKMGKLNAQFFNKCKVCGKTEKDDPELEFRIADDGEEYCMKHLDEAKK